MTPTAKSLKLLRELGYWAEDVTAYYHPKSAPFPRKKDVLGFMDIIAMKDKELLAVNATDSTNVAHHIRKFQGNGHLTAWLATGSHFCIHGWPKDAEKDMRAATAYVENGELKWEG